MAVKKNAPQQEIKLDPAVAAYMSNEQQAAADAQRRKEMSLTASQRRKRKKDKERIRDWYDLPVKIKNRMEEIARQHGVPKSQLAAFFLHHAIQDYDNGSIELRPYIRPSRVPRFESFLVLPDKEDGWQITGPSDWQRL